MRLFIAEEKIKTKIFKEDKLIDKYKRCGQKRHAFKYYKNKLICDLYADKHETSHYTYKNCNVQETRLCSHY